MRWSHHLLAAGFVVAVIGLTRGSDPDTPLPKPADRTVKFADDVQPLLKKHCLSCHGPKKQEAGFRVDVKSAFLAGGDTGVAVEEGDSENSLLIRYVAGVDPDIVMPPEGDQLTAKEVGILRAWIDQGLEWPDKLAGETRSNDHWAFQPIRPTPPPTVKNRTWPTNAIDRFVLSALESRGWKPSGEANRTTLIRRLSLDLLGLPPAPNEVARFLADKKSGAYERLVERMLASPHFGERWGRHWLDKARYADSDGYEKDNPRPNAWRWRDWVIEALNSDLPFDEFTAQQLAGDLIENASEEHRLATAFHRQTLTNTEGGTDKEQFRVEAIFDRVSTTGSVWLGLTVGCAQCHSHKYDPITQREYYQLFAFFNNADETSLSVSQSTNAARDYRRRTESYRVKLSELERELDAIGERCSAELEAQEVDLIAQLAAAKTSPPTFHQLEPRQQRADDKGTTFATRDDGSLIVGGANPDKSEYTLVFSTTREDVRGLRLTVLPDAGLPSKGPGRAKNGNFVLSDIRVYVSQNEEFTVDQRRTLNVAQADFAQNRYPVANAIDGSSKTGWAVSPQLGKEHTAVFLFAEPIRSESMTWLQVVLDHEHGGSHSIGRFRIETVSGNDSQYRTPVGIRSILATGSDDRSAEQQLQLRSYLIRQTDEGRATARKIAEWRSKEPARQTMNVRVLSQRGSKLRTTHVLRRGDFLQPLDATSAGVPSVLPPIRARGDAPDRLDFSRWLTSAENPLTRRVIVNEVWSHLFGEPLVRTPNDFGTRGERPTHPRLLDWLANELKRRNWSRKALIREIVLSATYRQSSHHNPEYATADPTNRTLHRQNRFRVEAEVIRDMSLAVAGLLSDKVGGPSVFPPMPADVAALSYANNFKWKTSAGEDAYRRGMYTFFKRTAPYPNLTTFDCPDSNTSCIQRTKSNTPLQALITLNADVFVRANKALASRVLEEAADTDSRIRRAFEVCLARPPHPSEHAEVKRLFETAHKWYEAHPEAAKEAIADVPQNAFSTSDSAAWVATVRILTNTDEFITRE